MKKGLLIASVFILILLIISLAATPILNSLLLPNYLTPQLLKAINHSLQNKAKLQIGRVYFHPWRGIMLETVRLALPAQSQAIFRSPEIDLDLDWLQLFQREVVINKLKISSAEVNIAKNRYGQWNFSPLFTLAPLEKKKTADLTIEIKEAIFDSGRFNCQGFKGTGNARAKFSYKNKIFSGEIFLHNFSGRYQQLPLFQGADFALQFTPKTILFRHFRSTLFGSPLNLAGELHFAPTAKLYLTGEVIGLNSSLTFTKLTKDQGEALLQLSGKKSALNMKLAILDVKKLLCRLKLQGELNLANLPPELWRRLKAAKLMQKISGQLSFSVNLQGMADHPQTYGGDLNLKFIDLTFADLPSHSFNLSAAVNNGLLTCTLPKTNFLEGTINGSFLLDSNHWGSEFVIDGCDLSALSRLGQSFDGLRGKFIARAAVTAPLFDFSSLSGGGYLEVKNADLRNWRLFSVIEEGIAQVNQGFKLPNFREVKGNFSLVSQEVNFLNFTCKTDNMDLALQGKISFAGQTDLTAGIKFLSPSLLKTVRLILFPVTIGFDILANSIRVNIFGEWPNLKQKTLILPMHWLDEFFGAKKTADPLLFQLDNLW